MQLEQLASMIVGIENFFLCLISEDGHNTLECEKIKHGKANTGVCKAHLIHYSSKPHKKSVAEVPPYLLVLVGTVLPPNT